MFMTGPKGRTSVGARRREPKNPHSGPTLRQRPFVLRRSGVAHEMHLTTAESRVYLIFFFFSTMLQQFSELPKWIRLKKKQPDTQMSEKSNATDVFSISEVKSTQMLVSISSPGQNVVFPPLLQEEDYPGAIQLCLECQKAASTFKHYSCIRYDMKWYDIIKILWHANVYCNLNQCLGHLLGICVIKFNFKWSLVLNVVKYVTRRVFDMTRCCQAEYHCVKLYFFFSISPCANGGRQEFIYVSEERFLTFVDYIIDHRIIAQRGGANEEMALWNHNAPARMQSA